MIKCEYEETTMPLKPLIIAGPTASGKSDAAAELAIRMNGSVISADSMQVYRGMDIGSAKITREEMRGVPHYLIDCADPSENWNVVRFQERRAMPRKKSRQAENSRSCAEAPAFISRLFYTTLISPRWKRIRRSGRAFRRSLMRKVRTRCTLCSPKRIRLPRRRSIPNNVKRVIRALEFAGGTGQSIAAHNLEQRAEGGGLRRCLFCPDHGPEKAL